MGDDCSPCSSGRSSRRSSIVSLFQRRMSSRSRQESIESTGSSGSEGAKLAYRVVVLGSKEVGKTAIISQFLYDSFTSGYKETVDEMYHGEFDLGGTELELNIQDTGGTYVNDFPVMVEVSLASADAVIIVFSLSQIDTFEEASRLRDVVHSVKGVEMPIVVVGNKTDLPRDILKEEAEATVLLDWENGYVECCAKDNVNINTVFKELLNQAKGRIESSSQIGKGKGYPVSMRRRTSLPQVPAFDRLIKDESTRSPSPMRKTIPDKRSTSLPFGRKDSCKLQ